MFYALPATHLILKMDLLSNGNIFYKLRLKEVEIKKNLQ